MTDAGSFIWDLEVHKAVACHTGYIANAFFTAVHALESFWHGEGIRTFFRGTVTFERCHLRGNSRDILRLCGQTLGPQLQPTLAAICFRPPDQ